MSSIAEPARELDYDAYQERQYNEVTRHQLETRADQLGVGGRAQWDGAKWTPVPYPGFAMQAMLSQSSNHNALSLELQAAQYQLVSAVKRKGLLYPLPPSSFHQTVASTFSGQRLVESLGSDDLGQDFPQRIEQALQTWTAREGTAPRMQLFGVGLFRAAIGVLGVFERPSDFGRVRAFRDFFYGHDELARLGLVRTRPFIGHLTLAYVEGPLTRSEKAALLDAIDRINGELRKRPLAFEMPEARLHRYRDLSAFVTEASYPYATL